MFTDKSVNFKTKDGIVVEAGCWQQHLDQFTVFLVNLGVIMVLGVEPTRQGAWKHSLSPLRAS